MRAVGFHHLFVANRGEVAVRIARACDELGIVPVFGASVADRSAPYLRGREVVCLGPAPASESYLASERVVQAARQSGCTALHPGWGFLAEDPRFASLCEQFGVTFVGPPAHVMVQMGSKIPAKQAMSAAGLTTIPGSPELLTDIDDALSVANTVGYPVLLKANHGGGGRGMRIASRPSQLASAYTAAQTEAIACFGNSQIYLEKLIVGGRHVEVQLLADRYGNVLHLGERDCSVQRNHQKLIEESPCPILGPQERERTHRVSIEALRAIGYVGAGTIEFLLDSTGTLHFMEMNTRLQVEHCVSEMRSGVDLVVEQIRVAAGHRLRLTQGDIELKGHAIECRINAEDPANAFRPAPGTIHTWELPTKMQGVRIDTHVEPGYVVPPNYDSLLCKVVSHAATRDEACDLMLTALSRLNCQGVPTTIPMHRSILASTQFRAHDYDTRAIPGWPTDVG
ncbi:MAG: biotin carboxylase N-terminal domain-containing protein [Nannocystaceae bacterium]